MHCKYGKKKKNEKKNACCTNYVAKKKATTNKIPGTEIKNYRKYPQNTLNGLVPSPK